MLNTGLHRAFQVGCLGLLVSMPFLALTASADEDSAVWAINSSNGRLLKLLQEPGADGFLSNTTSVVNDDANQLVSPRALALRRDGRTPQVLVADTLGGKIVLYRGGAGEFELVIDRQAAGSHFRPDGIDVDSLGNLFGLNDPPGGSAAAQVFALKRDIACPNTLGCLGGGYRGPMRLVDAEVIVAGKIVRAFGDSLVARRGLGCTGGSCVVRPGDLLVAVSDPAAVLVYRRQSDGPDLLDVLAGTAPAGGLEPEVLIGPDAFGDGYWEPTGIAIGPDGNLLISALCGDVLRFTPGGVRLADFTSVHQHGLFKIVTGPAPTGQQGALEPNAYLAQRNGGSLLRFLIEADGTGTMNGAATSGVQHPRDLALNAGDVIPVAAGTMNAELPLTSLLTAKVEQFAAGGQVSATSVLAVDPRPRICQSRHDTDCVQERICKRYPHHPDCSVSLADIVPGAPERIIPWNLRAADIDGVPTFVVVFVDDTAVPFGVIEYAGDGEQAGTTLDCDDADPTKQPQMAWAPDDDDVQLIVGDQDRFINASSDCGSSRGSGRDFSIFLFDVIDLLAPVRIAKTELDNLDTILHLSGSSCIDDNGPHDPGTLTQLRSLVDSAQSLLWDWNLACARDEMIEFDAFATQQIDAFDACRDAQAPGFDADFANVFGDVRSRAQRTSYQLNRASDAVCVPDDPH